MRTCNHPKSTALYNGITSTIITTASTSTRVKARAGAPRTMLKYILLSSLLVTLMSCTPLISVKPHASLLPHLGAKHYTSFDGDRFGYASWLPLHDQHPHTVIIGVHGISGYSGDYQNLGKHLQQSHQEIAIYAPETRGQGMDPIKQRIGDIRSKTEWIKDLYTFTNLARKKHPNARIVWLGESMGSLITMHAYHDTPPGDQAPDAIILASPIVDISAKLPAWKLYAAKLAAIILPKLRISLETLSSGERPVVTKDDIHAEQAAQNEWYVPRYTLRLLLTLAKMADAMPELAQRTNCPILIVHGGQDIFTPKKKVDHLFKQIPANTAKQQHYYPDSFHLLMYDHQREKIFHGISTWLRQTP